VGERRVAGPLSGALSASTSLLVATRCTHLEDLWRPLLSHDGGPHCCWRRCGGGRARPGGRVRQSECSTLLRQTAASRPATQGLASATHTPAKATLYPSLSLMCCHLFRSAFKNVGKASGQACFESAYVFAPDRCCGVS
jgi:hypothetical protein